jgi:hypothetical protein
MNRTFLTAAALAAVMSHAAPVRAATWTAIEKIPGASPVDVLVRDKPRVYFRVTQQAPLTVAVEGPTRLRVITRAELVVGSPPVVSYRLRASEGAKAIDELDTETSAAEDAAPAAGKAALGKSRRMTLDVPAGRHSIALALSGTAAVLVRLQTSAGKLESPMVSLTPVAATRSVTVSEGEKLVTYYSVLPGQPVKLRVVGPTTLELLTRLDFDATMRGTQSYRLRLTERGTVLREAGFKTTKAATASYTNLADRTPSKFDRLSVPLGDGSHEIAVELVAPAHGSAEIHARIPEPTVGNTE